MDTTRCPRCNTRMKVVTMSDGRTGFQCLRCDKIDPLETDAVEWATGSLSAPTLSAPTKAA